MKTGATNRQIGLAKGALASTGFPPATREALAIDVLTAVVSETERIIDVADLKRLLDGYTLPGRYGPESLELIDRISALIAGDDE